MTHDWSGAPINGDASTYVCPKCGINWIEAMRCEAESGDPNNFPHAQPCTGNAYICRVARKIRPLAFIWASIRTGLGPGSGAEFRYREPWEMTGPHLAEVICATIPDKFWVGHVPGLVNTIETAPTVCPILADALEDAG